jgi:hypothetical protein
MATENTKPAAFAGFDFGSAQVTQESLAELPLPMLPGSPVITVRPATEANDGYFSARLKASNRMKRSLGPNQDITAGVIKTNRTEERGLYGRYIVVGWANLFDTNKNPVPFSRERSIELMEAIPDWVFDDVAAFCREPGNFVAGGLPDSEGIAKN